MPALRPSFQRLLRALCVLLACSGAPLRAQTGTGAAALLALHQHGGALSVFDAGLNLLASTQALRAPLAQAPQIAPDARHVYWGAQDGSVVQLALPTLAHRASAPVCEGAAPLIALSADAHWLLAACEKDSHAIVFDARLQVQRRVDVATLDGRQRSGTAQLLALPERRSWLLAPAALNELWEISHDRGAAPIFDGLVHDYRMGEAIARSGFLGVRRTPLSEPLGALLAPPGTRSVVGAQRCGPGTPCRVLVLHLDARSSIAQWSVAGAVRPAASAEFSYQGRRVLALASDEQGAAPALVDLQTWRPLAGAALPQAARRVHAQPGAQRLWLQTGASTWLLVDSATLAPTARLQTRASAQLQFTHDGASALAAQPDALHVYDTRTLALRQRLDLSGLLGAWPIAAQSPRP